DQDAQQPLHEQGLAEVEDERLALDHEFDPRSAHGNDVPPAEGAQAKIKVTSLHGLMGNRKGRGPPGLRKEDDRIGGESARDVVHLRLEERVVRLVQHASKTLDDRADLYIYQPVVVRLDAGCVAEGENAVRRRLILLGA